MSRLATRPIQPLPHVHARGTRGFAPSVIAVYVCCWMHAAQAQPSPVAPAQTSGPRTSQATQTAPGAPATPAGPAPAAAAASAPPVSITTVTARQRDLPVVLEATGSVVPVSNVELRAQVTSVITKVHVKEGQFVRAGQPLFTLDSRADEANVARLQAQAARDQASLADAQRQLARSRDLLAQNFVSQNAVDSNQTLVEANQAAVAASRAAVQAAQVTLAYSRLAAPSAGRVGSVNVFVGSAVQANVTPLLTITQLDPVDVAFAVPQRHLGDLLAALKHGSAEVQATLSEQSGAAGAKLSGQLTFVDNNIDATSGTVKAKARFDNKAQKLWPGAFVRASLTVRTLERAVVLPQAAIIQSPRGAIVYVVEAGKVRIQPVQVQAVQGEEAAVSGLKGGEKVVLDGRQNLRPGASVVERPREGGAAGREGRPGGPGGGASGPRGGGASAPPEKKGP